MLRKLKNIAEISSGYNYPKKVEHYLGGNCWYVQLKDVDEDCILNIEQLVKVNINNIKQAFTILYRRNLSVKTATVELKKSESEFVKEIASFIESSQRGVCGAKRSSLWERLFLDYPYFIRTTIETNKLFLQSLQKKESING